MRKSYIESNKQKIEDYENLYNEVKIDNIKRKMEQGYFDNWEVYDLSIFRVFLDSCILLFNKEKFDDEKIKKEKIKEGKKEIIEEKNLLIWEIIL